MSHYSGSYSYIARRKIFSAAPTAMFISKPVIKASTIHLLKSKFICDFYLFSQTHENNSIYLGQICYMLDLYQK